MQVLEALLALSVLLLWTAASGAAAEEQHDDQVQSPRAGRQYYGQRGVTNPLDLVTSPNTSRYMSVLLVGQVLDQTASQSEQL